MSAHVSEIEVTNALSKALGLPSTVTGFSELLARVQQAPSAMREALNGDFTAYVMANGGAELIRKVETENVRLAQEARKDDPKLKYTGVTFDVFGRPIHGGVLAMARRDDGGASGARFDSMDAAVAKGDWGSPAGLRYMSNYAIEHGLPWAANNPELLKLGPAAIQAIADVHLRQDSYVRLKQGVGLSDKDVVAGARYFKKEGGDYNDAAKKMEEVHKGLNDEEQREHQKAIHDLFNAPTGREPQAKANFNKVTDKFKLHHPELGKKIDEERRELHTQLSKEHSAQTRVDASQARSDAAQTNVAANLDILNGTSSSPPQKAENGAPASNGSAASPKSAPEPKRREAGIAQKAPAAPTLV